MAITKSLTDAMGGNIRGDSTLGKAVVFVLRFRLRYLLLRCTTLSGCGDECPYCKTGGF
ncbi:MULTISPECIES: hypothetical protein [Clostridia]|uniref:hypothetical protein n=1 Tax=Clostridia TaxID=186801 RepID=UPI0013146D71|nr:MULTISPECIES: hypothetical protein [Clostridia]